MQSTDAQEGVYSVEIFADIDSEIPGGVFTADINSEGRVDKWNAIHGQTRFTGWMVQVRFS